METLCEGLCARSAPAREYLYVYTGCNYITFLLPLFIYLFGYPLSLSMLTVEFKLLILHSFDACDVGRLHVVLLPQAQLIVIFCNRYDNRWRCTGVCVHSTPLTVENKKDYRRPGQVIPKI